MINVKVLKSNFAANPDKPFDTFEQFRKNFNDNFDKVTYDDTENAQWALDKINASGLDVIVKFFDCDISALHCNIEYADALVTVTDDDKPIMLLNSTLVKYEHPGIIEHELHHVKQFLSGEIHLSESGNTVYNGKEYLPPVYTSLVEAVLHQHTLPWERPAYAETLKVYGGVPTADFFRNADTLEEGKAVSDSFKSIWKEFISEEVIYLTK